MQREGQLNSKKYHIKSQSFVQFSGKYVLTIFFTENLYLMAVVTGNKRMVFCTVCYTL